MPPTHLFHPLAPPKSGRLGSLTKKEQAALTSCRVSAKKRMIDIHLLSGPGEQEDLCALRFLRANKFDVHKTLDSMSDSIKWLNSIKIMKLRQKESLESVLNDDIKDLPPLNCYKICGVDRMGRPVIIIHLQSFVSISKLFEPAAKETLIRGFVWAVENALRELAKIKIKSGYIVEDFTLIVDTRDWFPSDGQLMVLRHLIELAQVHYPERMGRMMLIGRDQESAQGRKLGSVLQIVGLDGPTMFDRVSILPEFGWVAMITSKVDESELPSDYGGTREPANLGSVPSISDRSINSILELSMTPRSVHGGSNQTVFEVTPLGGVAVCSALLLLMVFNYWAAPVVITSVLVYFVHLHYCQLRLSSTAKRVEKSRSAGFSISTSEQQEQEKSIMNQMSSFRSEVSEASHGVRFSDDASINAEEKNSAADTLKVGGGSVQGTNILSIRRELQEFISDRCDGDHLLKVSVLKDENSWLSKRKGKAIPPVRPVPCPLISPTSVAAAFPWQSDVGINLLNSASAEERDNNQTDSNVPVLTMKSSSRRGAIRKLMRDAKKNVPSLKSKKLLSSYKQTAAQLFHVDVFEVPPDKPRIDHVASNPEGKASLVIKQLGLLLYEEPHYMILFNFQIPGSNMGSDPVSVVLYWGVPLDVLRSPAQSNSNVDNDAAFSLFHRELLQRFVDIPMSDDNAEEPVDHSFRDSTLRIGTAFIDTAPSKKYGEECRYFNPAKKHAVRYFRGKQYFEVDVDLSSSISSPLAAGLCSYVPLSMDIGVYLEGAGRLFGCARLSSVIVAFAEPLVGPAKQEDKDLHMSPSGGNGGASHRRFVPSSTDGLVGVFTDSGAAPVYQVRSKTYLFDRRKEPAPPTVGRLLAVDLFRLSGSIGRADHVAQGGRCAERVAELTSTMTSQSMLFMVNIQMPGTPPICLVAYWAVPTEASAFNSPDADGARTAFQKLFSRFIDLPSDSEPSNGEYVGGQLPPCDFRNMRFKLIPSIIEGPWLVKRTVGNTATLIGQKVICRYFSGVGSNGVRYMEIDIDVGSNQVAYRAASMAAGFAKGLTIDMGFLIQGEEEQELPELLIGCICISRLDMTQAVLLTGKFLASAPDPSKYGSDEHSNFNFLYELSDVDHSPADSGHPSLEANQSPEAFPSADSDELLESVALKGTFSDLRLDHNFRLRTIHYLDDQVKEFAGEPIGRLVLCDLFRLPDDQVRVDNIAAVGKCRRNMAKIQRSGEALFVLNYQVPGAPALSLVCVWGVPLNSGNPKFDKLFERFCKLPEVPDEVEEGRVSATDFRTTRFKLLPFIKEGPWIVRKMVGSGATLLAQKLTCRHFQGQTAAGMRYNELDIDIGSSTVANNTVFIAIGHAKNLVVDMGICIQGECEDELPEKLIGTVRLSHLNMSAYDMLCD